MPPVCRRGGSKAEGDGRGRKRRPAGSTGGSAAGEDKEAQERDQGFEKHNQFLWAKRMGQQNEPRWGLFKQGGSAGPAFLQFLETLERDGIIDRMLSDDVPENLGGVCGWTIKEGKLEEWQERRKNWFMEGKEGKVFKPNSLYQILRRLGFFPTMRSSRAGHGHDFEASTIFRWDPDRRYMQRRPGSAAKEDGQMQSPQGAVAQ
jgi:hypothetical protein